MQGTGTRAKDLEIASLGQNGNLDLLTSSRDGVGFSPLDRSDGQGRVYTLTTPRVIANDKRNRSSPSRCHLVGWDCFFFIICIH